jgi:ParB/Sulfiredoxin domain
MKLESTLDYSRFKRIVGNRGVRRAHIKNLADAIRQDATSVRYNPIVVNEKMEVIDGQHRLEAIKSLKSELNLPVYYIMEPNLTLDNVISLNSGTKAWTPLDFADSFIERGNKNYQIYKDFKEMYGLNHDVLMRYLSLENPITTEMFKQGKFTVSNVDKSHKLCENLLEIGQYYKRFNYRPFAMGFYKIWRDKQYNHKRMLQKLAIHQSKLVDKSLPEEYSALLQKIYNTGVAEENRVWFNTER